MKKVLLISVMTLAFFLGTLGSYLSIAKADAGMHFHCSVCNSHNHGSLHHRKK